MKSVPPNFGGFSAGGIILCAELAPNIEPLVLSPMDPTPPDPFKDPKEPLKVEPTVPLDADPPVDPKGFTNVQGVVDELVEPPVLDMVAEAVEKEVGIEEVVMEEMVEAPVFESVELAALVISKRRWMKRF